MRTGQELQDSNRFLDLNLNTFCYFFLSSTKEKSMSGESTCHSSLNFIRLLRVVFTPSVRGENDSKQSDEFQATCHRCSLMLMDPNNNSINEIYFVL